MALSSRTKLLLYPISANPNRCPFWWIFRPQPPSLILADGPWERNQSPLEMFRNDRQRHPSQRNQTPLELPKPDADDLWARNPTRLEPFPNPQDHHQDPHPDHLPNQSRKSRWSCLSNAPTTTGDRWERNPSLADRFSKPRGGEYQPLSKL